MEILPPSGKLMRTSSEVYVDRGNFLFWFLCSLKLIIDGFSVLKEFLFNAHQDPILILLTEFERPISQAGHKQPMPAPAPTPPTLPPPASLVTHRTQSQNITQTPPT